MPNTYDSTLKSIVADHARDYAAVFGLPTTESIEAINVDLSTISAATDVALKRGYPHQEIVDLNFQSGPDPGLTGRLLLYNALLHSRHRLPVRSILILLRSKADSPSLTGTLAYGEDQCRVEFSYEVIRIWEQPVEKYLSGGLGVLPLATLCQMPEGQPLHDALREVIAQIDLRLGKEASEAEAKRLMQSAKNLTSLRILKNEVEPLYSGVRIMTEVLCAWDEAELDGEIKGRQATLTRQGRIRFGEVDPETSAELASIRDIERLERMSDAILTATSWQELLATL